MTAKVLIAASRNLNGTFQRRAPEYGGSERLLRK
jgi:hypothetical protein